MELDTDSQHATQLENAAIPANAPAYSEATSHRAQNATPKFVANMVTVAASRAAWPDSSSKRNSPHTNVKNAVTKAPNSRIFSTVRLNG